MRGFKFVLGVSVFVPFVAVSAQQRPHLEPGTRVRVTAPECGLQERTGAFQGLRGDTLQLHTLNCPVASVMRFDVSQGRSGHAWRGAGIGLLVGIGYTIALGESAAPLVLSTALGSIVGWRVKTERWEPAPRWFLRLTLRCEGAGHTLQHRRRSWKRNTHRLSKDRWDDSVDDCRHRNALA